MDWSATRDGIFSEMAANGMPITLTCVASINNPSEGKVTQTTTDYTTFGIVSSYKLSDIDGTMVQREDKQVLIAAKQGMPDPTPLVDKLKINNVDWQIVFCDPIAPAGVAILYKVQIRR